LWFHDTFPKLGALAWQKEYSIFSVSKSLEEVVKNDVAGQAEHHRKVNLCRAGISETLQTATQHQQGADTSRGPV